MSKRVPAEKQGLAEEICYKLSIVTEYSVESESMKNLNGLLKKSSIATLRTLNIILTTVNERLEDDNKDTSYWIPPALKTLKPHDIYMPSNEKEMFAQMEDVHGMNARLLEAWDNGNLSEIKQFSECIKRVMNHCSKMVKDQLWQNLH